MKERIELQNVVLLGRTFEEYCTYFQLTEEDLRSSHVLDLGAGLSSFCAEATARGYQVTAADPVYRLSKDEIALKSGASLRRSVTYSAAARPRWKHSERSSTTGSRATGSR